MSLNVGVLVAVPMLALSDPPLEMRHFFDQIRGR